MDYRGVIGGAVMLGASALALTTTSTGCVVPDPGEVTYIERKPGSLETPSPTSSTANTSTPDGTPADSGTPSSGGSAMPANAFVGQPAFVASAAVGSSNNQNHGPNGSPTGLDCLSCHKTGGQAAGDVWTFAGTVYDAAGTTPVAGVEVRMVDNTGKGISVVTDANGSFWSPNPIKPYRVGIRNATITANMSTILTTADQGGCAKTLCHGTPTQPKIMLK